MLVILASAIPIGMSIVHIEHGDLMVGSLLLVCGVLFIPVAEAEKEGKMSALLQERDMWDEGLETIREGEVRTWDGRIVDLRSMISRRWGWPKSAASAAAAWLKHHAKQSGEPVLLHVGRGRWEQQRRVIEACPELLRALCAGLAGGASREIPTASRKLDTVEVRFNMSITDDGLTRGVLRGIAGRLGCTMDELRNITKFDNSQDGYVTFDVDVSELRHG